jgi:imidazolonepropionase-like amidohydrolase
MNDLLLLNGRVIDGTGTEPRTGWAVASKGGRIAAIGPTETVPMPDGARAFDVRGMSVMPGLIDAHTHVTYHSGEQSRMLQQLTETIELNTVRAVTNARVILEMGCTAIGDGGTRGNIASAVRDAVTQGLIPGPKIVAAGQIISGSGGLMDQHAAWGKLEDDSLLGIAVDGPEAVRAVVRRQVRSGVDWIKVSASGVPAYPWINARTQDLGYEELAAAVQEAAKFGKFVHAHAHDRNGLRDAVRAGVISLHSGEYVDDEGLAMMRDRSCVFVPTIAWLRFRADITYMRDFLRAVKLTDEEIASYVHDCADAYERCREAIRKAVAVGVPVAVGSDAAHTFPPFDLAYEMEHLQDLGIAPLDVIKCATQVSAKAIGRSDIGILEAGKAADVIVVDGDPAADVSVLRDKSRIVMIVQDGKVLKNTLT